MQRNKRLKREYEKLNQTEGISCHPTSDDLDKFMAIIVGPNDSPYKGYLFQLSVQISQQYPFEPPRVSFQTPIYHPNIDDKGRICMDILNLPPKGNWKPTIGLQNVLDAVQCLLANPNPDDPLMPHIAHEYKYNKQEYEKKARYFMEKNKCSANELTKLSS